MHDDMVERVARAIEAAADLSKGGDIIMIECARAAIEAMREPSEPEPVGWSVTWPDGEASFYRGAECPQRIKGNTYQPLYAAPAQRQQEPVAWVNGDELANMLDDRSAVISGKRDGWRRTPLYADTPAQCAGEPVAWRWQVYGIWHYAGGYPVSGAEPLYLRPCPTCG